MHKKKANTYGMKVGLFKINYKQTLILTKQFHKEYNG